MYHTADTTDQADASAMPEDAPGLPALPGSVPFLHALETAPAYWWLDILWVVLVPAAATGGRYSLMHETLPKGAGAPPHKHVWSDEHFYILDGEVSFLVGDAVLTGRTGDFVWVPRNTRHAFRVESETAMFLNGYTPAGLEQAVIDQAMPAPRRTLPPPGATPPPAMTAELMRRYGMDAVPGPNPIPLDHGPPDDGLPDHGQAAAMKDSVV